MLRAAAILALIITTTASWAEEYFEPLNQMKLTPGEIDWVRKIAPLAVDWAEEVQAGQLSEGRKLSDSEIKLAKSISVSNPENIRIIVTEEFPVPSNPDLYEVFQTYEIDSSNTAGMVLGYAVFIKPGYEDDIQLLAHEFVHVHQVESLGPRPFFVTYFAELKMYGYMAAPLETNARMEAWRSINRNQ